MSLSSRGPFTCEIYSALKQTKGHNLIAAKVNSKITACSRSFDVRRSPFMFVYPCSRRTLVPESVAVLTRARFLVRVEQHLVGTRAAERADCVGADVGTATRVRVRVGAFVVV